MNRFGAQLRKLRLAQNLTQEQLAEAANTSRVTVQNRERGTYRPDFDQREKYAAALGISLHHLNLVIDGKITAEECLARERSAGLLTGDLVRSATHGSHGTPQAQVATAAQWRIGMRPYFAADQGDATKRREALTGAIAIATEAALGLPTMAAAARYDHAQLSVLSALKLPPLLKWAFSAERCPLSTANEVEAVGLACDQYFAAQDATLGGGAAYILARALHHQASQWSHQSGQPPKVAVAVRVLHAELGAWSAWLAYDAGHTQTAHHHLQNTLVHARLIDCTAVEVRAMAHLCLVLNKQQRHAEALQVAQAALRIAGEHANPRLVALLLQRTACSHAYLGHEDAFTRSCDASHNRLEHTNPDNDGGRWRWVTERELGGLTGLGHATLGHHEKAQAAYQRILDAPDPQYRRNNLYYQVHLAKTILASGNIVEGAELLLALLPTLTELQSGRIHSALHQVRHTLDPHQSIAQARDFIDAFDQAAL